LERTPGMSCRVTPELVLADPGPFAATRSMTDPEQEQQQDDHARHPEQPE
jgi:hypothetical protein